jgi:hypothetical protein
MPSRKEKRSPRLVRGRGSSSARPKEPNRLSVSFVAAMTSQATGSRK